MDAQILKDSMFRATTLILSGEKHCYYKEVTEYAKEYAAHITGKGIEAYLIRYAVRESEEMFKQRCELTNAINPAVSNSLMKPFYKVSRNNNITQKYDFKNTDINSRVEIMLNDFNSDMMDNTNGLDTWLRTRFVELSFTDPNSFVVIEWDAVGPTETIKPRPFEVSSVDAWNYEFKGNVLQWLHVATPKKYDCIVSGKTTAKDGIKYTHYAQGVTIVFDPIDKNFMTAANFEINEATQQIQKISGVNYLITVFDTKLNYVPAFKVGYARDLSENGRVFVNPFNSAMPYFRKMLKTTSELDITMTAHVFPQKWQYVQACQGASPTEPCDRGVCPSRDNAVCTACNGSGVQVITSAQEIIYVPLPDDPKEAMDLDKMQAYKGPPIDLVKFQDEYTRSLKLDSHLAVYNSNMFLASDAQFAKTATEVNANMDGIYDALEPYTEKFSKIWKLTVYTCAALAGFNLKSDDFELVHTFPADPKLKTLSILLEDLKAVNDSDAPSFVRDIINNDIAEVVFNGDEESLRRYKTRHEFFPFNGKKSEEITMLLSTQYVSDFTKVLYSNFEAIFSEIERENDKFYMLPFVKQWEIVEEKVKAWKDEIISGTPEAPDKTFLYSSQNPDEGQNTGGNDSNPNGADDNPDEPGTQPESNPNE